jgi:hypothetical protein
MNRATAETAQQTAISEGLAPIQNWVKQLVDHLLITEFDAPDLEFCWRDERNVDPQQAASVAQIYVTNGIKTVNEARSDLGLDPIAGGDVPLVFTGAGPVPLAKAAGAARKIQPQAAARRARAVDERRRRRAGADRGQRRRQPARCRRRLARQGKGDRFEDRSRPLAVNRADDQTAFSSDAHLSCMRFCRVTRAGLGWQQPEPPDMRLRRAIRLSRSSA